jgi:hypothetical protein
MSIDSDQVVEEHTGRSGRTLLELAEGDDGTWTATQSDVDLEGTGETAALAAMEYCRTVAERTADE